MSVRLETYLGGLDVEGGPVNAQGVFILVLPGFFDHPGSGRRRRVCS